jgi:N-acylglucosamine-6-phosphate 2-epimerase
VIIPLPRRSIVVSCQAREDNPLHGPVFMAAMARAAEQGGANCIRANGAADIAAIRAATALPIIGILKRETPGYPVYITPGFADADGIAGAGADIIAVDATPRRRDGEPFGDIVRMIHDRLGKPVMADVSTLAEGVTAAAAGADLVATTLAGYTAETAAGRADGPDFQLLEELIGAIDVPVVAEGRFWTPEQVREAFRLGAHAVVIGTAITNPMAITRRFVDAQG